MSISFKCRCGHRMKAKDALAGKRIKCRQCQAPVRIPRVPEDSEFDFATALEMERGGDAIDAALAEGASTVSKCPKCDGNVHTSSPHCATCRQSFHEGACWRCGSRVTPGQPCRCGRRVVVWIQSRRRGLCTGCGSTLPWRRRTLMEMGTDLGKKQCCSRWCPRCATDHTTSDLEEIVPRSIREEGDRDRRRIALLRALVKRNKERGASANAERPTFLGGVVRGVVGAGLMGGFGVALAGASHAQAQARANSRAQSLMGDAPPAHILLTQMHELTNFRYLTSAERWNRATQRFVFWMFAITCIGLLLLILIPVIWFLIAGPT